MDAHFWLLVSFIIFVALVWKKAATVVTNVLDRRAEAIRSQLEEARALRNEAAALLQQSEQKHQDALKLADEILANAKDEVARYRTEARKALADDIERRRAQAAAKIEREEEQAVQDIRRTTAQTLKSCTEILVHKHAASIKAAPFVQEAVQAFGGTARKARAPIPPHSR